MFPISPVIIAVASSALLSFAGAWQIQDWRFTSKIATIQASHDKERAELSTRARNAEATYRQMENDARLAADREREKNREKVRAIDKQLSAALVELRQRPERTTAGRGTVSGEVASCAGVSGEELARGDAEFLVRFAADAAKVSAALKQCEAQYNGSP